MDISFQKRRDFVIALLTELKHINLTLKELNKTIENSSENYYNTIYEQYKIEAMKDVDTYNANIERMGDINNQIITRINEWYNFVNNPKEIKKVTYPIMFIAKRKKLKSFIKNSNSLISDIVIKNRFIRENLVNWEHTLKLKAVESINSGEEHKSYAKLISRKQDILSSLKYLIPTISNSHQIELNIDEIDSFIEAVLNTNVA